MKVRDIIAETAEIDYAGLCGKRIGSGAGRIVYEHRLDPHRVVKRCNGEQAGSAITAGFNQNRLEWEIWQHLKAGPLGRHLAPCCLISADSRFLVQERTAPPDYTESVPMLFLAFDPADYNYGIRNSRPVCHDYGVSPVPLAEFDRPGAAEAFETMLNREEFMEAAWLLKEEWPFGQNTTAADFADVVADARKNLAA